MATLTISDVEAVLREYPPKDTEQAAAITQFLVKHRSVARALLGAREHVHRVFGPVDRYLEFVTDPDDGSRWLFCVIIVDVTPEHSIELLDRFDNEWSLKQPRSVTRHVTFTVDND